MNTFHKILFVLAILIANCISASAAIEFSHDGVRYIVNNDNTTVRVAGYPSGSKPTGHLTIPESVTYGGISYPVTSIGNDAFRGCFGLTSVTIGNSVTSINDGAFYGCSGLTSVTIPNSVTKIGNSAFSYCTGLTSVTIGNSVTSINDGAFYGCSGLTSVTIPNSVISIGYHAFGGCSDLTSIKVESGNSVYDSRENCNAIIETATNTLISGCKNTIIPNSVTSIGYGAFRDCGDLTSVTIPNSVTSIGDGAFEYCSGLTSVAIPDSVTSIGNGAFEYCSGLTSVTIPNSVTSIGGGAFHGTAWYNNQPDGLVYAGPVAYKYKGTMPSGTSIVLKEGTKGIADWAFGGCSGLTSVTIPNSVTSIGDNAFYGCYGLTRINAYPNPEKVSTGEDAFYDVPKDGTLHVLPKYLSAYRTASQWKVFTNIKDDLTEIGDINLDGNVEVSDVTTLVNMIHNGETANLVPADINADGKVNVSDVTALVNIILN
ncbi:MAG: leucine-rich repeat protein [bacterium]|nr:leucine-rich repeat protein [bacterium]